MTSPRWSLKGGVGTAGVIWVGGFLFFYFMTFIWDCQWTIVFFILFLISLYYYLLHTYVMQFKLSR